ncbi:hypothetical protein GJ744_007356 [Endocarpon pusillum]|uniref:Uncharacterized protein n=1 Tax=Endocarpon pusillum TaxID=364733 RepID=A0A8H7E643_9EURO|nr:hypothetical protein GJ744_007356 [Endocarpon pusillum]
MIFPYALTCEKQFGVSSYGYIRQFLSTSIAPSHQKFSSSGSSTSCRYVRADFSKHTSLEATLLFSACHGLALSVDQAIADGADFNALGHDTLEMALYCANFVQEDHEDPWFFKCVQKILERNVHVNDADFLYAMMHNPVEIVELLLDHRPAGKLRLRTNGYDEVGPLYALAAEATMPDIKEKIDLFLDRGEDVNELCGPGGTALHAAILRSFRMKFRFGDSVAVTAASYLLERGADPNISCVSGLPLVLAWSYVPDYLRSGKPGVPNMLPLLSLLLSHGARFEPLNAAVATLSEEEMWDFCKLSRGEYVAKYKTEEEVWDLCKLSKKEYIAKCKIEDFRLELW